MSKKPLFFYGWVIVGISFLLSPLVYGIRNSFAVFYPYILDEFSWSRGGTAAMLSISVLVYGLIAPVAGNIADRWKPRSLIQIGILTLALGIASCAFVQELWHFYLLFGIVVSIGTALGGWPLIAPALSNWFHKKRGLVIGLGQAGGGLGYAYGIIAELLISSLGWRYAYFAMAGMLIVIVLPLYRLFFYYHPERKGLTAYGIEEIVPKEDPTEKVPLEENIISKDWTLSQTMRTYQLWMLILSICLFWGIGGYLVLAHQVKFAVDIGYTTTFAASIFGLFGLFVGAGHLCAFISDWIGRENTITLSTILAISSLIAMLSISDTTQPWLLYVYAIGLGYGGGLFTSTVFAGAADLFHGKNFGSISGIILTGFGVGGAIGPWLGGYIYDVSGSYDIAFIICIACYVLGCIAFWIAAPRKAIKT
ncbi:MFS transporter [Chloroflexota bacterium]